MQSRHRGLLSAVCHPSLFSPPQRHIVLIPHQHHGTDPFISTGTLTFSIVLNIFVSFTSAGAWRAKEGVRSLSLSLRAGTFQVYYTAAGILSPVLMTAQ